jgi:hypothetical protein
LPDEPVFSHLSGATHPLAFAVGTGHAGLIQRVLQCMDTRIEPHRQQVMDHCLLAAGQQGKAQIAALLIAHGGDVNRELAMPDNSLWPIDRFLRHQCFDTAAPVIRLLLAARAGQALEAALRQTRLKPLDA